MAATALEARFEAWESRRACGTCTACCFIHAIVAVPSAAYRWCQHCTPGVGCGVYETRPAECRGYYCAWRLGFGSDDERPDRSGMLVEFQFVGPLPIVSVWRPLEEAPGQLGAALRMADDVSGVLREAGYPSTPIHVHGVPPTRVVRWQPERSQEGASHE